MAKKTNSNTTITATINAAINKGLDTLDPHIFGAVASAPEEFVFFAALNDGEAAEEEKAMAAAGVQCVTKRMGWGVSVTDFREEIEAAIAAGKTPILSELEGADQVAGAIIIDHHNAYVGRPAALLQVLHLLGQTPTRFQQLVAANDAGYFAGMEALGASAEEMAAVRAYDRSFQLANNNGEWVNKFTPEVEAAAEEAIANMVVKNGVQILHFKFDATAAITDRLWQTGVPQNLLILCETGESDYFGEWQLCCSLQGEAIGTRPASWDPTKTETVYNNFGGWIGGSSTVGGRVTGFWGGHADQKAVEDYVLGWFGFFVKEMVQ